jgi:hypothetical protein
MARSQAACRDRIFPAGTPESCDVDDRLIFEPLGWAASVAFSAGSILERPRLRSIMKKLDIDRLIYGRDLVKLILAEPDKETGRRANDLLSLFWNGLPIAMLIKLLDHSNTEVVQSGLFIAEELGDKAASVFESIAKHLKHADPRTRYAAYEAVANCSSGDQMGSFLAVVYGLRDSEVSCRKIAMLWMMRVDDSTLSASLRRLQRTQPDVELEKGLRMLLEVREDEATIDAWLAADSSTARKFGVIAASRIAPDHPQMLQLASNSGDTDIRGAAAAQLTFLAILKKHGAVRRNGTWIVLKGD